MKRANSHGYTGPEIQGSSTGWVRLAEGKDVLPPSYCYKDAALVCQVHACPVTANRTQKLAREKCMSEVLIIQLKTRLLLLTAE